MLIFHTVFSKRTITHCIFIYAEQLLEQANLINYTYFNFHYKVLDNKVVV